MSNTFSQQHFIERYKGGERAILVQIDLNQSNFDDDLQEFKSLADSASVKTQAIITGRAAAPSPKFFMGTGKAEEVAAQVAFYNAEVVLVNHALSAAQGRNCEELFKCRVLDRAELILDIFAQRAQTFEGKLQVELAQLQHLSTRLVRGWTHLERQKGGIGLRGPGETQLESDRRLIAKRIEAIKKRIEKVAMQRKQGRQARKKANIPTISLVGYTNAGKSTLFNRMTQADVYVANQLFATLDPTLRHIHLPAAGKIILADTVGFIRDLPHDLIAAFRATLEETRQADLLLHVVDASHPDYWQSIRDVETVLQEIGAGELPRLYVYNKIDLRELEPRLVRDATQNIVEVWLSARTGAGVELLKTAIVELLPDKIITTDIVLKPEQGRLRSQLYELGSVVKEEIDANGDFHIQLRISLREYHHLFAGSSPES